MEKKMRKDSFYFIAEVGVNHEGDLNKALQMVEQIADAGAHAAKFQAYKAEKLVVGSAKSYWDTGFEKETSQLALFKKYDMFGESEYSAIKEKCIECGVDFLATPFDLEAVDMLDKLSNSFKIASADLTNVPLLKAVGGKNKHVIISGGASSFVEIEVALRTLEKAGAISIDLLHCVLNYPCKITNSYLAHISNLKAKFENDFVHVGYSDHIPSSEANDDQLIVAMTLGCRVFERHFTYDTSLEGNDHYHSLDQQHMARIIERMKRILPAVNECEEEAVLSNQQNARMQARRSLVLSRPLKAGDKVQIGDLICKRPGTGISPTEMESVIGKSLVDDLDSDTILKHEHLVED
jgi:sialic acid synthase SpsE